MITTRQANDFDWQAIGALASASVRHVRGAPRQDEWLRNRVAFTGRRWRFVAENQREIIGYGAFEGPAEGPVDRVRQFIVVPWDDLVAAEVADALMGELTNVARFEQISSAWMREYARDDLLIDYLLSRGFQLGETSVRGDQEIVNLDRRDAQATYRIERTCGKLDAADEAALGIIDGDVFGIEPLNLEWRSKDDHYVLRESGEALCHVGVLDGVHASCADEALRIAGIGGVVTRDDRRRTGLARRVLSYVLRTLSKESQSDFALLFCLDRLAPYYQGLGWRPVAGSVHAVLGDGFVKSPLNVLVYPLREGAWPEGSVTVNERHF